MLGRFFFLLSTLTAGAVLPSHAQAPSPLPAPPAAAAPATAPVVSPPAGQQAQLELGRTTFPINEYFTIAFRLRGAALQRYSAFPDIEGFKKSQRTSTTTTRTVNGRSTVELRLTQRYAAYKEGEFVLKPFSLTVNGQVLRSAGAMLRVTPQAALPAAAPPPASQPAAGPAAAGAAGSPTAASPTAPAAAAPAPAAATPAAGSSTTAATPAVKQPLQGVGLLDQLLGKPKIQDYVEPPDQAFLAVEPDKASAWVGEPVHVGLYFYLAPSDQGLLDFYRFAEQLPPLLRQLRQPTAWQETFEITDIRPDSVRVGGKPFLRFQLHEAVYYPLNTQSLRFPALALQMKKYRLAKRPVAGLDNRLDGYKVYFSQPRTVQVRALPGGVGGTAAVGRYRLLEGVSSTRFRTGHTITYTLTVEGEGNLTALTPPVLRPVPGLEVYGPDVRQELTRADGRVTGRKVLRYRLVPRQPGPLRLRELLTVPVFNPDLGRYDTLRPDLVLPVSGPAVAPPQEVTAFVRTDPFYAQQLVGADGTLQDMDLPRQARHYTNAVLGLLLLMAAIGWWTARRP